MGEATVTLNPEYLGAVTVSLRVQQGVVMAHLQADTPQVRSWMEAHTQELQSALQGQGLHLGQLAITPTNPDTPRRRPPSSQPPARLRPSTPPAGGGPTFEIHA
ncbi:MAG TPA: flagellar hook-length control protein FliK [Vicinamibacterales bacterium]|nr:flagellar hook-length control protein FliK [Vicinamibacterales bacterium]